MNNPEKSIRQKIKENLEATLQSSSGTAATTNDIDLVTKCLRIAEVSLGMIRDLSVESDLFTFSDEGLDNL